MAKTGPGPAVNPTNVQVNYDVILNLIEQNTKQTADKIEKALHVVSDSAQRSTSDVNKLGYGWTRLEKVTGGALNGITRSLDSFNKVLEKAIGAGRITKGIGAFSKGIGTVGGDITRLERLSQQSFKKFEEYIGRPMDAITAGQRPFLEFITSSVNAGKAIDSLGQASKSAGANTADLMQNLSSLSGELGKSMFSIAEMSKTLSEFGDKDITARFLLDTGDAADDLLDLQNKMADITGPTIAAKRISALMAELPKGQERAFAEANAKRRKGIISNVEFMQEMVQRGARNAGVAGENVFGNPEQFKKGPQAAIIAWDQFRGRVNKIFTDVGFEFLKILGPHLPKWEAQIRALLPKIGSIFKAIAPIIEKVFEKIPSLVAKASQQIERIARGPIGQMIIAIGNQLAPVIQLIITLVSKLASIINGLPESWKQCVIQIGLVALAMKMLTPGVLSVGIGLGKWLFTLSGIKLTAASLPAIFAKASAAQAAMLAGQKSGIGSSLLAGAGALGPKGMLLSAGAGYAGGLGGQYAVREMGGGAGAQAAGGILGGIGAGAAMGSVAGPYGAAVGGIVGGLIAATDSLYKYATAQDLVTEKTDSAAQAAQQHEKRQKQISEHVRGQLNTDEFQKVTFKIQEDLNKETPNIQKTLQQQARAEQPKASDEAIDSEVQRRTALKVNELAKQRVGEHFVKTGEAKGIKGVGSAQYAEYASEAVTRVTEGVLQQVKEPVDKAMSDLERAIDTKLKQPIGTTTKAFGNLTLALSTLQQADPAFDSAKQNLETLTNLLSKLGPNAEVGGKSLKNMYDSALESATAATMSQKQLADSLKEQEAALAFVEKGIKALREEAETETDPKKKAEKEKEINQHMQARGAILGQISEINSRIEKQVTAYVGRLELAVKREEGRLSLLRAQTEQAETLLQISQGLYGTAALNIEANVKVIQSLQQQKAVIRDQIRGVEEIADEEAKHGRNIRGQLPYQQAMTDLRNKELQVTSRQVEMVKQLRDGYLDAVKAQATSAGHFSKIIIDNEKNMQQGLERGMVRKNFLLGQTGKQALAGRSTPYRLGAGGLGQIDTMGGPQKSAAELQAERMSTVQGLDKEVNNAVSNLFTDIGKFGQSIESLNEAIGGLDKYVAKSTSYIAGMRASASMPGSQLGSEAIRQEGERTAASQYKQEPNQVTQSWQQKIERVTGNVVSPNPVMPQQQKVESPSVNVTVNVQPPQVIVNVSGDRTTSKTQGGTTTDKKVEFFRGNAGSIVPGQDTGKDTVPALLRPGEFVVNRASTQKFMPVLEAINSYQNGGLVQRATAKIAKGAEGTSRAISPKINLAIQLTQNTSAAGKEYGPAILQFFKQGETLKRARAEFEARGEQSNLQGIKDKETEGYPQALESLKKAQTANYRLLVNTVKEFASRIFNPRKEEKQTYKPLDLRQVKSDLFKNLPNIEKSIEKFGQSLRSRLPEGHGVHGFLTKMLYPISKFFSEKIIGLSKLIPEKAEEQLPKVARDRIAKEESTELAGLLKYQQAELNQVSQARGLPNQRQSYLSMLAGHKQEQQDFQSKHNERIYEALAKLADAQKAGAPTEKMTKELKISLNALVKSLQKTQNDPEKIEKILKMRLGKNFSPEAVLAVQSTMGNEKAMRRALEPFMHQQKRAETKEPKASKKDFGYSEVGQREYAPKRAAKNHALGGQISSTSVSTFPSNSFSGQVPHVPGSTLHTDSVSAAVGQQPINLMPYEYVTKEPVVRKPNVKKFLDTLNSGHQPLLDIIQSGEIFHNSQIKKRGMSNMRIRGTDEYDIPGMAEGGLVSVSRIPRTKEYSNFEDYSRNVNYDEFQRRGLHEAPNAANAPNANRPRITQPSEKGSLERHTRNALHGASTGQFALPRIAKEGMSAIKSVGRGVDWVTGRTTPGSGTAPSPSPSTPPVVTPAITAPAVPSRFAPSAEPLPTIPVEQPAMPVAGKFEIPQKEAYHYINKAMERATIAQKTQYDASLKNHLDTLRQRKEIVAKFKAIYTNPKQAINAEAYKVWEQTGKLSGRDTENWETGRKQVSQYLRKLVSDFQNIKKQSEQTQAGLTTSRNQLLLARSSARGKFTPLAQDFVRPRTPTPNRMEIPTIETPANIARAEERVAEAEKLAGKLSDPYVKKYVATKTEASAKAIRIVQARDKAYRAYARSAPEVIGTKGPFQPEHGLIRERAEAISRSPESGTQESNWLKAEDQLKKEIPQKVEKNFADLQEAQSKVKKLQGPRTISEAEKVHLAGRAEARMTAAKQAKRAEEIVDSLKSKEIIAKNRYLDKLATIEPGMPAASQAKSGLLRSAGGAVLKGAQKGAAGTIKGAEAAASGLFKATGHIGTGAVKAAGLAGEASDFALRNVGKLAKTGLRVAGTAGTIYEAGGMVNALAKDRSGTALAMRGSNLGAMGAMMAGGPVGWALGIGTTAAGLIEQGMAPKGDKKSALEWVEEGQEATRTSGAYAGQVGKYINETRLPLLDIIAKNPRSDEAKIARALDKRKTEQAANLKIAELKTKLESQGPISKLGDWLSRGYGPDSRQAIQRELADAKEQAQKSRTESFEELGLDPTKDRQKGIEDAIARLGGGKTREDQLLEYYKKKGEKDFESQTALGSTGNVTAFKEYGEIKKAIREGDKGTIQVYENKMNQGQKQARTINAVKSAGSSVGEFLTKLLRQDGKAPAATAEKDTKTMEIRKDPREEKITKAVRAVEDVKVEEQNKLNEQTHTVNQAQSRIESLQKEMQRIEQARQEIFHKGDATGKYVFGAVENQKLQILRNQEQKLQMAQKTGKIPERQLKDVPKPVQDRLDFLEKESETAKSERTKIHQTSGGRYNASTNKQLADLREREKQANDEQVRMLSENMGVPELPSVKTESPPDVRKSKQVQTPKEPNMPELELKYQSRLEGPMYPSVFNQPPPDVREAKQVQTPKEPKIAPINMPELKLKHQSKLEGPMYPSVFNQPMPQLEFSPIDHAAQQKSAPVKAAGASTSLSTTTGHPADMAQRGLEYAIAGIKGFGSVWTEGRDKVNRQPTQINSGGGYNA